jgi:hypothetical protein
MNQDASFRRSHKAASLDKSTTYEHILAPPSIGIHSPESLKCAYLCGFQKPLRKKVRDFPASMFADAYSVAPTY